MLSLSNLTLILSKPNTLYITNKELKISSGSATAVTKSVPRSSKDGQIIWDDVLSIPNQGTISFQIVTKHQFGYNPEQLSSVIQGDIRVGDRLKGRQQRLMTAEVLNLQNQKVGYLKVNIKLALNLRQLPSKYIPSSESILPKQQKLLPQTSHLFSKEKRPQREVLLISSIVAHIDSVKGKTVKLKLTYGGSHVTSEEFASKSGELVFINEYELKSAVGNHESQLKLDLFDDSTSSTLGSSTVFIDQLGKVTKKNVIKDIQGRQLGEIFLEGRLTSKQNKYRNRSMLDFEYSPQKESPSGSLLKSSVNLKRSVVNTNSNIMFGKEKRFFGNLQDKKNPYVSYQDPGTLQFQEPVSKRYYRGASFGRGEKYDFTSSGRNRPGVGEYFLPTIWDRY